MNCDTDLQEIRRIRKIVQQLQTLGWDKVKHIDQNFRTLKLSYRDENTEKTHELSMTLPQLFPVEPPEKLSCPDLPPSSISQLLSFDIDESKNKKINEFQLSGIFWKFVKAIETYRPLRRMLRDLDENTWVLDPPEGSDRKNLEYCYRRVAISKGVSLQVDLKLENCVDQLPSLKFLGSESKIRPLRDMLGQNIEKYDPDYTLVQNLEMILELEFPQQERIEEQDDLNLECAICYSYRLADQFPSENCDDPSGCGKSFHQMCLFEWLRSLPEQCSKMSFRSIFGQCPYCEKQISCKLTG